ncbi:MULTISPECIES: response regulator [Halanaerobiaceae]|nr:MULTISPECIES: response regulator [Halanaerobiaceae]
MTKYNILIAEDEPLIRMDLKEMVAEYGYNVVADVGNGEEAVKKARSCEPDLAILDIKMPGLTGLKVAEIMHAEDIAPVILLTAYSQSEFIEDAKNKGVMHYLIKPVDEKELMVSIELVIARYKDLKLARQEVQRAYNKLSERKIIERAKGVLMTDEKFSEKEAYQKIQRVSMNRGISMKEIAEMIIINSELK